MNIDIFVGNDEWNKHFSGWVIVDCAIRNRKRISILKRKVLSDDAIATIADHEIETKAVQIQLDREINEKRVYRGGHLVDFNRPVLGVSLSPVAQDLIVAKNKKGSVFAAGSGRAEMEYVSPEGKVPGVQRIVCIDGYAYSVGTARNIYKRVAVGEWEQFNSEGLPPYRYDGTGGHHRGFNDMDGPDESLLYAVGGHGDVWRFDGSRWIQCDFPSNEQLGTVTVAPDG